jgi:hypothetical protein
VIGLEYKDTVRLVKPVVDGHGSEKIGEIAQVPALFMQNTGWSHGANQSAVTSDASVYVDPTDEFVTENFNRLDGMLVIANMFGVTDADAWYRVSQVVVGQDKLLGNNIDNVQLFLKKSTGITNYAS